MVSDEEPSSEDDMIVKKALNKIAKAVQMGGNEKEVNLPTPKAMILSTGSTRVNFERFEKTFDIWMLASGYSKKSEAEKSALLLSVIGEEALEVYFANNIDDKNLNASEILKELKKIIVLDDHITVNRFAFNTYEQGDQKFDIFLVELRKLFKKADYESSKDSLDDLLRDKIIQSIQDKKLQKELLKKKNPKLEEVVQACRVEEATKQRQEAMTTATSGQMKEEVMKVVNEKDRTNWRECKYCGNKHEFKVGVCRAFGKKCLKCNKLNHFAKCCPQKESKIIKATTSTTNEDFSYDVNEITCKSDGIYKDFWVRNKEGFPGKRNVKLSCYLDTGACTNLIGYKDLCDLLCVQNVKLVPVKMKLKSYGGHDIEVLGKYSFELSKEGRKYNINFNVTKVRHGPLLSRNACIMLNLIKFCNSVENRGKSKSLEEIMKLHSNVFEGLGRFEGDVTLEVDENVKPILQAPRRHPLSKQQKLKEQLDDLLKQGVILKQEEHTEWCSNIMLIEQNGKHRIVLDPIPLNKALKRPNYQFTKIEEILPKLGKGKMKIFSKLDARKGFWQVQLDEESSKLTTFWTPFGRYRWKRLPFGISPAPEIFQHKQNEVLQGLEGIEVMADDILVYGTGDTDEEAVNDHNKNLEKLLERLNQKGCKLNKEKLSLLQKEITFYGHVISEKGLRPDPLKVAAIKNLAKPKTKEDLHRFLGMVNYLAKFIPDLSTKTELLRKVVHSEGKFEDLYKENEHGAALRELQNEICKDALLKFIKLNEPIVIEADSSSFGLGACLSQNGHPLYYASRVLTTTEKKYAQIEKELLAIRFACQRFDQFIAGNKNILVKTDHKPLISIFKKPILTASKRIQVMLLLLQRYNVKIEYTPGKELIIADTLSRAPDACEEIEQYNIFSVEREKQVGEFVEAVNLISLISISDERLQHIKKKTEEDAALSCVKIYIERGWPENVKKVPDYAQSYFKYRHELTMQDGFIIYGQRIVIPASLRRMIIEKLHMSHQGIDYTLNIARDTVFWPKMAQEISDKVASCTVCAKYSAANKREPMLSHEIPSYPYQLISMDICELMINERRERFLISVCHYSDYIEIDKIVDMTANTIVNICKKNFARSGIPEMVVTDGGLSFCNKDFEEFSKKWQFKHVTSSPHHQQGNGKAEAAVKVAKMLLKKSLETGEDWELALLNQRNTPNNTGFSPNARNLSRNVRGPVPVLQSTLKPKVVDFSRKNIQKLREKSKIYYDKGTKDLSALKEGEAVWVKVNPKLRESWSFGKVSKKISEREYLVDVNGTSLKRNRIFIKLQKQNNQNGHEDTSLNWEEEEDVENENEHNESNGSIYEDALSNEEPEEEELEEEEPEEEYQQQPEAEHESSVQVRPKRIIKPNSRFKDYVMESP